MKTKIMPLGDSMTHGFVVQSGGYRARLCQLICEHNLQDRIEFAGSQYGGNSCYDARHEGHPGWAVDAISAEENLAEGTPRDGLLPHVGQWLDAAKPDVVLLQIGTNDILSLYRLNQLINRALKLIHKIYDHVPGCRLFAASIPTMDTSIHKFIPRDKFTQEDMTRYITEYNSLLCLVCSELRNEGKDIRFVDVNAVIRKKDLLDGVHPTQFGYDKIGQLWFDTLTKEGVL